MSRKRFVRSNSVFELGVIEVTPAAESALDAYGIDCATLFARHASGDWGVVEEWCARENDRAISNSRDVHAISSRYEVCEGVVVRIVTAMSRARTRLQLDSEYRTIEVNSVEGYRIWAPDYDAWNGLVRCEEQAVAPILAELVGIRRAVDVGTGTGRHALALAARGTEVVAIDESSDMLGVARAKAAAASSRVQWLQARLGAGLLPLASDAFDLLICALMLTHVDDLPGSIAECARVVRQGSTLLFTEFHPATRWAGWRTAFGTPDGWIALPNAARTRDDYIDGVSRADCDVALVRDIGTDGSDYGEVSEAVVRGRGVPPLCLLIVARKN
jgi:SAM-dependent methyltransferase